MDFHQYRDFIATANYLFSSLRLGLGPQAHRSINVYDPHFQQALYECLLPEIFSDVDGFQGITKDGVSMSILGVPAWFHQAICFKVLQKNLVCRDMEAIIQAGISEGMISRVDTFEKVIFLISPDEARNIFNQLEVPFEIGTRFGKKLLSSLRHDQKLKAEWCLSKLRKRTNFLYTKSS
jgi:hypothetical protein